MTSLIHELAEALRSAEVGDEAQRWLAQTTSLGLASDWNGSEKEADFARLAVAIGRTFPPGGALEIGVLRGGTAGLLVLACAREAFHVSIDPYGLSTQSYPGDEYRDWSTYRATARRLAELADTCAVVHSHFLMDSASFIRCDLLQHPGRFNVVHLDGDHTYEAVHAELAYFTRTVASPAVYVMDDHDANYPGVGAALADFPQLVNIFHNFYEFPPYGTCGFSAWFHGDDEGRSGTRGGVSRRDRWWRRTAR